ncbi:hypothetical protein [Peribacillus deserti]|uniref:Uncharacterized protein n=1 Tax=Peribacillus deserti TaxID=673318 RepID=A0A2N5M135_9BACI|nr:hypothetical protein [Peribacillus deserti]PLT28084.1 hypothetical protein CUU66_20535 [Peribacillus deserti]
MNNLHLQVTHDMEKAMQQNHGIGYSEYSRDLDLRIEVEKKREKSYSKSHQITEELNRRMHT